MITLGNTYELTVIKKVEFGFYVDAKELGEVLLPRKHAPGNLAVGDCIEVFLYLDSEMRRVATTQQPKAQVGEFAYLTVAALTDVGAFLDWGLDKDLLVPFSEQHRPMEVGQAYLVYLYLDKASGRITASGKLDKFLDDDTPHHFKQRDPVNLIIANSTDLGFKVIINHRYWGMLYREDAHQRVSFGQSLPGYIQHVRPDRKINVTLQGGQVTRDKHETIIMDFLKTQHGFAAVHDNSAPQEIAKIFGMSKAAFKRAIGSLYKQKVITIGKDGIRLVE